MNKIFMLITALFLTGTALPASALVLSSWIPTDGAGDVSDSTGGAPVFTPTGAGGTGGSYRSTFIPTTLTVGESLVYSGQFTVVDSQSTPSETQLLRFGIYDTNSSGNDLGYVGYTGVTILSSASSAIYERGNGNNNNFGSTIANGSGGGFIGQRSSDRWDL